MNKIERTPEDVNKLVQIGLTRWPKTIFWMTLKEVNALTIERTTEIISSNYLEHAKQIRAHQDKYERLENDYTIKESMMEKRQAYDSMTWLLNRGSIKAAIRWNISKNIPTVLLTIDLNKFKELNDRYSHPMGDATLKEFGKICDKIGAKYDGKFARNGGDEFMGIFPEISIETWLGIADEIRIEFAKIYQYANTKLPKSEKTVFDIPCTASIWVSHSWDISKFTGIIKRQGFIDSSGKLIPDTSIQSEEDKNFSIFLKMWDLAAQNAKFAPENISAYEDSFAIETEVSEKYDEMKIDLSNILRGMNTDDGCEKILKNNIPNYLRSRLSLL